MQIVSPNHLNIAFLQIMGLSVKEHESPIGMFGTGMKYAIAVLLRNFCAVTMQHRLHGEVVQEYTFGAEYLEIGKTNAAQVIMIDNQNIITKLPFTLDYGKLWSVTSAVRELMSNARDEVDHGDGQETVWIVEGAAVEDIKESDIFLQKQQLEKVYSDSSIEVFRGATTRLYYRDILVFTTDTVGATFSYTYNILDPVPLTEDRTVNPLSWSPRHTLIAAVKKLIEVGETKHLVKNCYETLTQWKYQIYDDDIATLLPKLEEALSDGNSDIIDLVAALRKRVAKSIMEEIPITEEERKRLATVIKWLSNHYAITLPIKKTSSLPEHCQAIYAENICWVSEKLLTMSEFAIAAAIFEEQVHHDTKYNDCSRDLQNWLFERLLTEWNSKSENCLLTF